MVYCIRYMVYGCVYAIMVLWFKILEFITSCWILVSVLVLVFLGSVLGGAGCVGLFSGSWRKRQIKWLVTRSKTLTGHSASPSVSLSEWMDSDMEVLIFWA